MLPVHCAIELVSGVFTQAADVVFHGRLDRCVTHQFLKDLGHHDLAPSEPKRSPKVVSACEFCTVHLDPGLLSNLANDSSSVIGGRSVITASLDPTRVRERVKNESVTPAFRDRQNPIKFPSGSTVMISGATGADAATYNITAVATITGANTFTYTILWVALLARTLSSRHSQQRWLSIRRRTGRRISGLGICATWPTRPVQLRPAKQWS